MYVSPLFETIPDLEGMPAALDALLANDVYRELVKNNSNTQEVMLGYSDSCKDGGVFASQFGLYEAQKVRSAHPRLSRLSSPPGFGFGLGLG